MKKKMKLNGYFFSYNHDLTSKIIYTRTKKDAKVKFERETGITKYTCEKL